jgi:hypothetical protein
MGRDMLGEAREKSRRGTGDIGSKTLVTAEALDFPLCIKHSLPFKMGRKHANMIDRSDVQCIRLSLPFYNFQVSGSPGTISEAAMIDGPGAGRPSAACRSFPKYN